MKMTTRKMKVDN